MRAVIWVKDRGAEFAEIALGDGQLRAAGVAVGASPLPYRLEYELHCGPDRYLTRRLSVRARGAGWARRLELERSPQGQWSVRAAADGDPDPGGLPAPGGDAAALSQALDCDLGGCPLTNTMPVLREGLLRSGSAEFIMAWVSVPALAVRPARQRYAYLRSAANGASVIRYQGKTLAADVTFGPDGLVTDYPGLGWLA